MLETIPVTTIRPLRLDYTPLELYIETTNRCNLACKTCPQFFGMQEDSADLGLEQVRAILDQAPGVKRVVLHGIGEPLLNPALPEIVREVKSRGAYALFNSNGLLLRGRLVEPIVRSGLDELRVSVDSATPETYQKVRGVDGLGRIFKNLEDLAALKARVGATTPKVSLWITGMALNVGELPALVRKAAALGIAEVYLQRLVYSGRGIALDEQSLFHRADGSELDAVNEARRVAAELGVELKGSGEASADRVLQDDSVDVTYRECRRPWTLMYVTSNGNVLPCCITPFTTVPYGDIVLGNVFQESLEDIWNGPRYQDWRRRMLGAEPPEACKGCGKDWSL
ncbi:MAG: radical SAM/SPASM domain-containing protein [Dehalococcoidia bacterium]